MKEAIRWVNIGRDRITYSGRVEMIPTAVWMSPKEIKEELSSKLFDEGLLFELIGMDALNDADIVIEHVSCWMQYHVFRLEVRDEKTIRVALNLLPSSQKEPLFKHYWKSAKKAWEAGVVAEPLLLSKDGRLFIQEWVDGIPVSEIVGEEWIKKKEEIITSICNSILELYKVGYAFHPLTDYEVMLKDGKAIFLDITRLREVKDSIEFEEMYKNSIIKNVRVIDWLKSFC
ncbi:hypothetical protein Asulf_01583 [Archaeoglobus sulfaticallidus PM70-1]|uniref:Aminoglycoside phosphotransferase domain-containing protein n=1 Tax=Archaeoglobus sulfaticallidus PM70-1 TaxID=387631 RepID=N0BMS9_9EURY|nr:hypothetical protein [Archaeoglobus sulfaticallidus]AGK61560.1 hypothetical protein Asulf_01583 [Archaeoglobus sulfaticallidus PM70-1]